jgi:hypothetical protein
MMHFWRSLDLDAGVHNFTFKTEAVQKRIGYFQERPGHTKDQIINDLASVFMNLQDSGEWEASYGKIAQRKNPIVALSTKVEKTSKDSKALSATRLTGLLLVRLPSRMLLLIPSLMLSLGANSRPSSMSFLLMMVRSMSGAMVLMVLIVVGCT